MVAVIALAIAILILLWPWLMSLGTANLVVGVAVTSLATFGAWAVSSRTATIGAEPPKPPRPFEKMCSTEQENWLRQQRAVVAGARAEARDRLKAIPTAVGAAALLIFVIQFVHELYKIVWGTIGPHWFWPW